MNAQRRFQLLACGLLPFAVAFAGCTPHTTEATEVGIKYNKLTGAKEIMAPGANYFFLPVVNDWKKYDVSLRNLTMTAAVSSGDRQGKDDLRFKTRDGNDIDVDVTIRWRIDPTRVSYLWKYVAPSTNPTKLRAPPGAATSSPSGDFSPMATPATSRTMPPTKAMSTRVRSRLGISATVATFGSCV